jgi:membrane-bound metal-dependent hydrolase YbcI (DUF457 family)
MKGSSHAVVGLTTGILLTNLISADPKIVISATVVGSIIPDIDEEHSTINKIMFPVKSKYRNILKALIGIGLFSYGYIYNEIIQYLGLVLLLSMVSAKISYKLSLFKGFQRMKHHRTMFHNPLLALLIFVFPAYQMGIQREYLVAFSVGLYLCHYFMDMFNTYGLPLYPIKRQIRMPLHYNSKYILVEYLIIGVYMVSSYLIYGNFL